MATDHDPMAAPPNPNAFPLPYTTALEQAQGLGDPGMTLRDWFAGQALAGLLASCHSDDPAEYDCSPDGYAAQSYDHADAMLAERQRATGDDHA